MTQQTETKTHFDKIAAAYEKVPETWKSVYDRAKMEIEPLIRGKVVLDIGNGGYFPYDTNLAAKVIALDISPAMLERVKDPTIVKQVGDATDLKDFADESLEVILFILSIHHINGRSVRESYATLDKVLDAAHRKLKKGGSLVIVEPTFHPALFFLERIFFWPERLFLSLFKVSMIFFYSRNFLNAAMARHFGYFTQEIPVVSLPIRGFIDPLGGSFPGLIRIPSWLSPTRYFLLRADKK